MTTAINIRPVSKDAANLPVLEISHLAVGYHGGDGFQRVVHDVSIRGRPGVVVDLGGETGSGKTTTAQALIGLLAENGRLEAGAVRLNGTDIAGWSQKQLDTIRGKKISLIPQDPTSSLNPVKTIGAQVAEVLQIHRQGSRAEIDARVIELLGRVGLSQPELRAKQYPHELAVCASASSSPLRSPCVQS
jgi:peptide/nickel transport system ATP-binding protein